MGWASAFPSAEPSSKPMAATSPPEPTKETALCSSLPCLSPNRSSYMSDRIVIHIVDDDAVMRDSLGFLLDVNGYEPLAYESADAFLDALDGSATGCVISDIRMPGMNGIELVRELRSRKVMCPVILITGP